MTFRPSAALLAALALVATVSAADASACHAPKTGRLVFARGSYCAVYAGDATHLRTRLRAGQRIVVTATPDDDGSERSLSAFGPFGEQHFSEGYGSLEFIADRSGEFEIGFSPCSSWHKFGKIELCAY